MILLQCFLVLTRRRKLYIDLVRFGFRGRFLGVMSRKIDT